MRLNGRIRCNVGTHSFVEALRILLSGGRFALQALLCGAQSSVEGRRVVGVPSQSSVG